MVGKREPLIMSYHKRHILYCRVGKLEPLIMSYHKRHTLYCRVGKIEQKISSNNLFRPNYYNKMEPQSQN